LDEIFTKASSDGRVISFDDFAFFMQKEYGDNKGGEEEY